MEKILAKYSTKGYNQIISKYLKKCFNHASNQETAN